MQFGVAAPDEAEMGSGSSSSFIRYFNKDGSYHLRFLDEWVDWLSYWEHFSEEHKCSYPCTANKAEERKDCPGCQLKDKHPGDAKAEKEAKASKKYLVNAIRTDDDQSKGYVDLWKIPGGLKADVKRNADKYDTLSDREYIVIRTTEARTNYSLDREDKDPIDLALYADKKRDKQAALTEAWNYRWDEDYRSEQQAERNTKKDAKAEKGADVKPAPKGEEKPPFEQPAGGLSLAPDPEPEPEPEEELTLTTTSIRQMNVDQLMNLYRRASIPVPDDSDQPTLAEGLIRALSGGAA